MIDPPPIGQFGPDSYTAPIVNLRIGVTGHRHLKNRDLICSKINDVVASIQGWFEGRPYSLQVLSSLADGADRLVAKCVLGRAKAAQSAAGTDAPPNLTVHLRAILPMSPELYCRTFSGVTQTDFAGEPCDPDNPSVREFRELLAQASSTLIAPLPQDALGTDAAEIYKNQDKRHEAYRWAGHYVVDHCDILIVIWDGKREYREGSTWQVYQYARKNGRSLVVIHAESAKITWLVSGDDLAAQYFYYQQYHEELSKTLPETAAIDHRYAQLLKEADRAGLSKEGFADLRQLVLPRFMQARNLAAYYQNLYYRCGWIGYSCAALAVCTAATLSLWLREASHVWYALEALLILITGICGWLIKNSGWQRKWIDYRYLAERLRATSFLYIAGIEFEPAPAYPDTQFHWLPDGWVTLALRKVWNSLPALQPDNVRFRDPAQIRALGAFLFRAWIDNQQLYYFESSKQNKETGETYENLSLVLLATTLIIATAYGLSQTAAESLFELPHVAAVAFPAITSAVAGILIFRHHARNAERYGSMSHFLWEVGVRLLTAVGLSGNADQPPDLHALRLLVQNADRAMAHEHEGWRTVFGVRLPGPG